VVVLRIFQKADKLPLIRAKLAVDYAWLPTLVGIRAEWPLILVLDD
jgi:hypothetical protein